MEFEWDARKAESNEAKHGVDFRTAQQVFDDPWREDMDVTRLGDGEFRRKCVGRVEGRLFAVIYTLRQGKIRLISARATNIGEERIYGDRHL